MRLAASSCFAFALAACGGTGGDVVAPTEAPGGADEIVQELFEICGTAMNANDVKEALPVAGKLGWELDGDLSGVGPIDIMRSTMIRKSDVEQMIQLTEHDGAHNKSISCQLIGSFGDNVIQIDPAVFNRLEGFEGRWAPVKGNASAGSWSKRDGNSVLNIFTTVEGGVFSMVSMNKSTLK